ncbi:class I SAM-dependent methyltransferase [Deinococcus apachensis]|uniref:class I SAM-dependent methyltransferase n=1 Tax=Deinococcus apachensis TaxID=309886 RepID=UPI0003790F82|nr:class I SAM-dependent methyltransferase [Deinococcus apachensis]
MHPPETGPVFAGSIPQVYAQHLVPLIFEPYAADLASRVARRQPARVLEIAAGTGVVTRHLARVLPPGVPIVATDLSQPMLDQAAAAGTERPVEWRQADAQQLPFPDGSFDVVVCQFGAMFFPDKVRAFAEARRVLRPGGGFIFNVWDRIEENEFPDVILRAVRPILPDGGTPFMIRIPHGYHDAPAIARDLARAGFTQPPTVTTLAQRSHAESPRVPAVAFCQGTPMRAELERLGPTGLTEATDLATAAIASRFGPGVVDGKLQALVVAVEREEAAGAG